MAAYLYFILNKMPAEGRKNRYTMNFSKANFFFSLPFRNNELAYNPNSIKDILKKGLCALKATHASYGEPL